MPWCFGASGSVRTKRKHQSAKCAPEVHTFWPLTTKRSPLSIARVRRLARSPPAPGSEKPWHHRSSPARMAGRCRFFCASVPSWIKVGPNRPIALAPGSIGAWARKYSSSKITCWIKLAPRPPYSLGQEIPTQPAACIFFCQATRFSSVSRSGATRESWASSTLRSSVRLASSQARNSRRNSACSGASAKSIVCPLWAFPFSPPVYPSGLEFSVELGHFLGFELRGLDPLEHRRQVHDPLAIGVRDRVELDAVGAKAGTHRGEH